MDDDMSNVQHPLPPTSGNVPTAVSEDIEMRFNVARNEESDSLPDLMDVSDSSDSGSIYSAADVHIMMHAEASEEDIAIPSTAHESSLDSTSPSRLAAPRSNNRRTRVEDDEDSERDRRHPSQRISDRSPDSSQSPSRSSSSSPSQSPSPTHVHTRIRTTFNIPFTRLGIDQTDPLRFFQHMMPQQQQQPNHSHPNDGNEAPSANSAAPPQPTRPSSPNTLPTPQEPHPQPHGNDNDMEQAEVLPVFAEMLMRLGVLGAVFGGFLGESEVDDPERARRLVDGLETVPIGLVRRLERVGGTSDEDGGRDTMCAICWDQLLEDAGFGKPDSSKESKSDNAGGHESAPPPSSSRSSSPSQDGAEERKYSKIVSLPCAHVFHADCLIPWFSRPKQTTCPTCRFNIDPENLTRNRRRRSAPRMPAGAPPDATQHTQNNGQFGQPHTTDNNDNATQTSQNGNGRPNRPGQFTFDQLRFPIVIAGRPVFPFNAGPDDGGQDDGPNRETLDRLRVSLEERIRARTGQVPSQSSNGSSADAPPPADGPTTASDSTENGPPTQPTSPESLPQPNSGIGPDDEHTVTHSIVFGFDVVVGGPMMDAPAEGNIDDGGGDGNERDFMGMMMGELFSRRAEPGANANAPNMQQQQGARNENRANHGGHANANATGAGGAGQNSGTGGMVPPPRFFNMNLGNLHITSGSGSTMNEAMTQMLNGMGVGVAQPGGNSGPAQNVPNAGTGNTNARPQENVAPQNTGPAQVNGQNQNQNQNQGQQGNTQGRNGRLFGGMGAIPIQLMTQLFGLSSPTRVRRRNNPGENQPAEAAVPPPTSAEAPQPSQAESTTPSADNGQAPAPAAPQGNNASPNDEGTFTRFMRSMIGNIPVGVMMGAVGAEDMNAVPAAESMQTNAAPSEKRQWTPPPAPGPTLRQRIEKRERDVGLRCYDVSCGIGPSDEDPLALVRLEEMKQLTLLRVKEDGSTEAGTRMCGHTFHPSCLVSTERVALRGGDAPIVGDEVEVSCSVCRAVGRVSRREWEEGLQQLS